MFGAVFALLGLLLIAIVIASPMRTPESPIDADAQEQWVLIAGIGAIVGGGSLFGWMLRLPLLEKRESVEHDPPRGDAP